MDISNEVYNSIRKVLQDQKLLLPYLKGDIRFLQNAVNELPINLVLYLGSIILFDDVVTSHFSVIFQKVGPGSSVGTATGYGPDGSGIESRWGEIFRTCPYRPWGPHSPLYNGHRDFPGGRKRPERDADPSPPSSAVI
jgi:hypothetical protein